MTDIMVLEKIDEKLQKEHGLKLYHSAKKNRTYYTDKEGVFLRLQFRPKDPGDLVACFVIDKDKKKFGGLGGKWTFDEIASVDDFARAFDNAFLGSCVNKILNKLVEKPYASQSAVSKIGNVIQFGRFEWIVLDENAENNTILIQTKDMIDAQKHFDYRTTLTWAISKIRANLNGDFYYKFTPDEQEQIALSVIETKENPKNNPSYEYAKSGNTEDKIFLLSIDEFNKYHNGKTSAKAKMRIRQGHDGWWLRSPGYNSDLATFFHNQMGILTDIGVDAVLGVRPALWLKV